MIRLLFLVTLMFWAYGLQEKAESLSGDQIAEKDGISYSMLTNEPYDGAVLNFFPNGQLDYKGSFKNGKSH